MGEHLSLIAESGIQGSVAVKPGKREPVIFRIIWIIAGSPGHDLAVGLQDNGIGIILIIEKIGKYDPIRTEGLVRGTIRQEAGRQEITIVAIPGRDDPLILVQRSCIEFWSDVTQV